MERKEIEKGEQVIEKKGRINKKSKIGKKIEKRKIMDQMRYEGEVKGGKEKFEKKDR